MPASYSSQGSGPTVTGALSSVGALSQNPEMLRLLLSGMAQGNGLIPSMNTGFSQTVRPAPMADWGPLPQRSMPTGAAPNDIAGILSWMKAQGIGGEALGSGPMPGPLTGGYR